MLTAGLVLIAVGFLIAIGAVVPFGFDFAVAVAPGWHVVIFPPPLGLGGVLIVTGSVGLMASLQSR
jgi:hypothetical protein